MSAAFEAALGQLGLIERNDLATMAIAKVIIGLAKEGERRPSTHHAGSTDSTGLPSPSADGISNGATPRAII
jgi:hypothetical protein